MLQIKELSITYPPDYTVLKNINLAINPEESIAIIGANGSGKTSLLLALTGLIPSHGTIVFNDLELNKKTSRQFRQKMGFVFQNPDDQLFCTTIRDDLSFGLQNMGLPPHEIETRVSKCLDDFNLTMRADNSSLTLSGGEKRMAALGTVLVMQPEILLLDEPTSFLDRNARLQLESVLQKTTQTKLIATHDIPFASRMCCRALLLGDKTILYDGPANELLHDAQKMHQCGADALDA